MTALTPAPGRTRSFAREAWFWIPLISNIQNPLLSEVDASVSLHLGKATLAEQLPDGSTSTDRVKLPRFAFETSVPEVSGETTYSLTGLQVAWDPQGLPQSEKVKAWEAMTDFMPGYAARRQGPVADAPLAASQFIDIWPAELGKKVPTSTAKDASGIFTFTVDISVTGEPAFRREIKTA